MPRDPDITLPGTIRRSSARAQRLFTSTLSAARSTYGDGRRAWQTAYAALKRSFERVGDRWVAKPEAGPSDERAATGHGATAGGVDARSSRRHLLDVARRLDVRGRSRMTKAELVAAIRRANDAAADRARER